MSGRIKIYRDILERQWYEDPNTFRLFIHCILKANFEDKKWQGILVRRGSFITSLGHISKELHLTIQQTRTSLVKLSQSEEISVKSTNKYTLITVIKYADYQDVEQTNNKQITNEQQTNNKPITTTKEYKNNKDNIIYNKDNIGDEIELDKFEQKKLNSQIISKIIDTLENFVKKNGLLYEHLQYERSDAYNFSRRKDVKAICHENNMTIEQLILAILTVAQTNSFWKNKITTMKAFSKHWVKIFNLGIDKMSSAYSGNDIKEV